MELLKSSMAKATSRLRSKRNSEVKSPKSFPDDRARNYGLRALATVVFDIDSGQRLDALYPSHCDLSDAAKKSIAHLALPHSNRQDEGDTQFVVRFRADSKEAFLYGIVLFRQQKDTRRSRGYFQKSVVIVSERPYIDLYDRILRVIGPLYFQVGTPVLEALYENICRWPPIVFNQPVTLPVAGTSISCIIPSILDYNRLSEDPSACQSLLSSSPPASPVRKSHRDSFETILIEHTVDKSEDVLNPADIQVEDTDKAADGSHHSQSPQPSLRDLLSSRRTGSSNPYETAGLYSSFIGVEHCLWNLWQFAITGESLLVLAPHARTCSQAVLAFTSLIAPLQFQGDYRPYYALYEADFDTLSKRQNNGKSQPKDMTIIGTTNPFFMKSLNKWPNALVFPFIEPSSSSSSSSTTTTNSNKNTKTKTNTKTTLAFEEKKDRTCLSSKIKSHTELDSFDDSDRARLLRRCSRYMQPDETILRQLIAPVEIYVTQTAIADEEAPFLAINNSILQTHFRKLTNQFLRPFDQFFGIWKPTGRHPSPYINIADYLKPFSLEEFLKTIDVTRLPPQIRPGKWQQLYRGFVHSPHFEPWFQFRRQQCIDHFNGTMRQLRENLSVSMMLSSPCGEPLTLAQYADMEREITQLLEIESKKKLENEADEIHLQVIEIHLDAVQRKINSLI